MAFLLSSPLKLKGLFLCRTFETISDRRESLTPYERSYFITYFLITQAKLYTSLVSTLPKFFLIKLRRKRDDLSPKSITWKSKDPLAIYLPLATCNVCRPWRSQKSFCKHKDPITDLLLVLISYNNKSLA